MDAFGYVISVIGVCVGLLQALTLFILTDINKKISAVTHVVSIHLNDHAKRVFCETCSFRRN